MKHKAAIMRKYFVVIFLLLVLFFFLAAGLYFSEINSEPETFSSILDAMWYVLLTLTTVGYGNVYLTTFGGQLFTMLTAAFGYIIGLACFIWIVLGLIRLGTFLRKT